MALIKKLFQEDTQNNQQAQPQQAPAQSGKVAAGKGSIGGVNNGPSSVANNTGGTGVVSTPTQATPNPVNLQDYVNANKGAGKQISGQVETALGNQYNTAKTGLNNAFQGFKGNVNKNTNQFNANEVKSKLDNATQFAQNPNEVTGFQNLLGGKYAGPSSFANDTSNFNQGVGAISKAQNQAGALNNSESGFGTYYSGINPQQGQTQGDLNLNNLFYSGYDNPNIANKLGDINTGLNEDLQGLNQQGQQLAENAQTQNRNVGTQAMGLVSQNYQDFANQLTTNLDNLQKTNLRAYQDVEASLKNNTPLTDEQLDTLGMTRTQYDSVKALIGQQNENNAPINNLAVLGTQDAALAAHNPTIRQRYLSGGDWDLSGWADGGVKTSDDGLLSEIPVTAGKRTDPNNPIFKNLAAGQKQQVADVNNFLRQNNLMIKPGTKIPFSVQGVNSSNAPSSGDAPVDSAALLKRLIQNGSIVASPNQQAKNFDFSPYLEQTNPNALTLANTATPQQYAYLQALNNLTGMNNTILNPSAVAQAGTAPRSLAKFDAKGLLDNLNTSINNYNNNKVSRNQTALNAL